MNRTKKMISETFWQLLEEKPYGKITVQNIVDRCQVNRNTFYYHFQDIPGLAEYSIEAWAEQVIENNCDLDDPGSCITLLAQEFVKRKTAFIHIYRSSCTDAFIRYLNKVSYHIVQCYIENATKDLHISPEDKAFFVRYYKCTLVGIVLDWLAVDSSYDLPAFCEKMCIYFEGSGKEALLKQTKEDKGTLSFYT